MATISQSMTLLKKILAQDCTPEDRRMYEIEWTAFNEVQRGDPFDETRYHHANERYIYRAARERAELQRALQG